MTSWDASLKFAGSLRLSSRSDSKAVHSIQAVFTSMDADSDADGIPNGWEDDNSPGLHYEYDELGRIIKIYRIPSNVDEQ